MKISSKIVSFLNGVAKLVLDFIGKTTEKVFTKSGLNNQIAGAMGKGSRTFSQQSAIVGGIETGANKFSKSSSFSDITKYSPSKAEIELSNMLDFNMK